MMKLTGVLILIVLSVFCTGGDNEKLLCGADQPNLYLPLLQGKNVALVVNNTSRTGNLHLVDFLLSKNVNVIKIFAPEHGFRGNASAGAKIVDGIDKETGIPVVSLYGKIRKPTPDQLKGIDLVVFDIQDVGCRFYTYISTLHLVMESCAENNVPLLVLDRPNPNGDYVAGPVLDLQYRSFVGMDKIPVVHGCTVGELARMINGEGWLKNQLKCTLSVIPVKNYTHLTVFEPEIRPSPNLPNYSAIRLYPSLCFFEATSVSVGRGTDFPFQVLGGTNPKFGTFEFTPKPIPQVADNPLNQGKVCYGVDLRNLDSVPQFTLEFFINFRNKYKDETQFLTREHWFNLLAGTDKLLEWIREGKTNVEIESLIEPEITEYKSVRKKYLIYSDFE
ncbi:MAG: hypothetical protein CSA36_02720 [Draconibacterium sp.]|nr:MAG: hypothetical protein CSA36_02720 [Draconibacterium sp.]